jgi:O-acetyl-ADP-ribose deacetylase (regulator of RNase III)
LAHTLFDDVADEVRHRSPTEEVDEGDRWQLEMLCNIAAGELLMPAGTFPELTTEALDIEHLMDLRKRYDVSTEALMLRIAKISEHPAAVFAASRIDPRKKDAPLRIDYSRGTRMWSTPLHRGQRVPRSSSAYACTAVGYTARGDERWRAAEDLHVEVVGIPPYPGQPLPRVAGLLRPLESMPVVSRRRIEFITGDATRPTGAGPRLIAHVVNDRTANWGGAFARALREEYPVAQEQFRAWVSADQDRLQLGAVHVAEVDQDAAVATMVAQRGYGESQRPRIRYDALRRCLDELSSIALERGAAVHMPRIGAGMAGGDWNIIAELIDTYVVGRGVEVTVYSLPGDQWGSSLPRQQALTFDYN